MRTYLIARHFINGKQTFEELRRGIDSIRVAQDISGSRNHGFQFGLKIAIDLKKTGDELAERTWREIARLNNTGVMYDPVDRGPGMSYRQVCFNPTFLYDNESGVVIDANLDQYVIDTEESLEQIVELTQQVKRDEALYATGSRDVPVVLAVHQRNSGLRILHELFHSLTIGSDKLRVGRTCQTATQAYAEIGESTSGFYVVNFSHPRYAQLSKSVADAARTADMSGFATDYYVAIKSAELAHLASGYVKSTENKFYEQRNELEELEAVKRLISSQTRALGKTDIRGALVAALRNRVHTERLSEFYPKEDVNFVRELMLQSLA